jgi:hypothetical protein
MQNATILMQSFHSNSLHRLKRRMKLKILQAGMLKGKIPKGVPGAGFTWVTGGDGRAAGYGNL